MLRKLLCAALALTLAATLATAAFAAKIGDVAQMTKEGWPWADSEAFSDALAAKDDAAIIRTSEKLYAHFIGTADPAAKAKQYVAGDDTAQINHLWAVLKNLFQAYERTGDTANALRILRAALPFAEAYKATVAIGSADMDFAIAEINNKIQAYDAELEVYAEVYGAEGGGSYTGSRLEPRSGAYYGEVEGHESGAAKTSSGMIVYVEFETESVRDRMGYAMNSNGALDGREVIELAWNLTGEGKALKGVLNERAKITEAAQYLATLDAKFLVRFGAEMNIWTNKADAAEYIAAFRFVADIVHANAPNAAMVWSVNYMSHIEAKYEDYYPGDAYVDWVGVSLYTVKYRAGDKNQSDSAQAIYGTGKFANPLLWIQKLVSLYGAKKPIIIAEGGVEIYSNSNKEDVFAWADARMRMTYEYIPILYPQVKGMFYFNTIIDPNAKHDFRLDKSPAAVKLYNGLTASPYFLAGGETESALTYAKLGSAILPAKAATLDTYAPYFTLDGVTVTYKLNDGTVKTVSAIPYRATLDLSGKADGSYTLTVTASAGGKTLGSKTYGVRKLGDFVTLSNSNLPAKVAAKPTATKVTVDGIETAFDAYYIGGNNYFKLRDIAYVLNGTPKQFEIGYDEKTKAITLTTGIPYTPEDTDMKKGSGGTQGTPTSSKIYLNGEQIALTVYTIGGSNYFKLRDLGRVIDFGVELKNKVIWIESDKGYTPE
jgi:hypothetical protein